MSDQCNAECKLFLLFRCWTRDSMDVPLAPAQAVNQVECMLERARKVFEDDRNLHARLHRAETLLGIVANMGGGFPLPGSLAQQIRDYFRSPSETPSLKDKEGRPYPAGEYDP